MLIRNLIYILQLDLYDIKKFLKFSYTHLNWWNLEKRGHMTWTKKTVLIEMLTVFMLVVILLIFYFRYGFWGMVIFFLEMAALPILISFSVWCISPVDKYLKKRLIEKARSILKSKKRNLKIIGITGSYGKTSTREILFTILSDRYRVVKMEENINTDVGIADFIVKHPNFFDSVDIFIVEMGAYKKGEIRSVCNLVDPDYSILTGINDSHLERFGSLENIIQAKFELPEATRISSVVNLDDENVKKNYSRVKINKLVGIGSDQIEIRVQENFQGLEFMFEDVEMKTKLLGRHNVSLILMGIEIAKEFGMSLGEISRRVENIQYVPHRLEPIYNEKSNIWVIDDSYNGNYNGIVSGLEVLGRSKGRKIVLTPGLVELGSKSREIHEKIGNMYIEKKIDLVLLIKNESVDCIVEIFRKRNFENYKVYASTNEAHNDLVNVMKSGDTIIFQNDLPDNYF